VLVGTLVDGDGHSLPRVSATFNHWSESGVCGGQEVVTDHEGRFRIELPSSFAEASSEKRTIGLVGTAHRMALFDARRAFPAGVYDIGDFLFADEADARALRNLSDDGLLSRLDLLKHWSSDAFDACLSECARRGGQKILAHLEGMEREGGPDTDTALATARNRAARLADPLVLEVVDGDAPIACRVGELPIVRLAFINRDPLGRTLRLECSEPKSHDESVAVDCNAIGPGKADFFLLRPEHSGLSLRGTCYDIAPGEQFVVPIALSHYIMIASSGRYQMRLALRVDGYWELRENARELPCGVLFNYSKPFLVDVAPSGSPGSTAKDLLLGR
jgi:hypothetical protein